MGMIMAPPQKSPIGKAKMVPATGYTLIELLVVLAIMALVAALSPPILQSARHGVTVRWAAIRLDARLESARETALNSQQMVPFTLPDGQIVDFYPDGSATGITDHLKDFTVAISPISGRISVY